MFLTIFPLTFSNVFLYKICYSFLQSVLFLKRFYFQSKGEKIWWNSREIVLWTKYEYCVNNIFNIYYIFLNQYYSHNISHLVQSVISLEFHHILWYLIHIWFILHCNVMSCIFWTTFKIDDGAKKNLRKYVSGWKIMIRYCEKYK